MPVQKVFCFGDSNTYGFAPMGPNSMFSYRYGPETRWPGVMQTQLGEGYLVLNEGMNGRTVGYFEPGEEYACGLAAIEERLEEAAPVDLVLIMLGSNDMQARFRPNVDEITENMRRMIALAQKAGAGEEGTAPKILLVSPVAILERHIHAGLRDFIDADAPQKLAALRSRFEALAREMQIEYFDASTVARASGHDGLHLDEKGHRALAGALAGRVREIL